MQAEGTAGVKALKREEAREKDPMRPADSAEQAGEVRGVPRFGISSESKRKSRAGQQQQCGVRWLTKFILGAAACRISYL